MSEQHDIERETLRPHRGSRKEVIGQGYIIAR